MDQQRIGSFLKQLRREQGLTQAQIAERLGVTNRSVSRWETGRNLPDFDLLLQLAQLYGVGAAEILEGERKARPAPPSEETLLKVADYSSQEKIAFSRRVNRVFLAGLAAMAVYMALVFLGLDKQGSAAMDFFTGFLLGAVLGVLILGVLYTSGYMAKVRAFKLRLLRRGK